MAAPLYERGGELEALQLALDDARARGGRVVTVLGPAGIGKSRLLSAARELAQAGGVETLTAAGAEAERDFPFGVALQLFEGAVREASAKQRAKLLSGAAALAGPLFGADFEAVNVIGAPRRLFPLLHGLFWLCSNLTERAPLLLVVDDLHWCDEASLRFLLYVAQRISSLRALLVVSTRPGEGAAAEELRGQLVEHAQGRVLRLAPLSSAAVRTLIEEELGFPVGDPLVAACAQVTAGNPFFLRELLAALRSEGIDASSADPERVLGLAPEALTQRLLVRVMRLAEPAPALARALAILGDRASLRHAAALAGVDPAAAGVAADALARAEILDSSLLRSGGAVSFAHPIVRTAIYNDQSASERGRGHAKSAQLLLADHAPVEEVASQLLRAEPGLEPRAVECLRESARLAAGRGAPKSAARLLQRALAEPLDDAQRAPLLMELAALQIAVGEVADAERHAREAHAQLQQAEARAQAQQLRGRALYTAGRLAEAADAFEQGLAEVPDDSELGRELRASFATMCLLEGTLRARGMKYFPKIVPVPDPTPSERLLIARLAAYRAFLAQDSREEVHALVNHAWGQGTLLEAIGVDGEGWSALCAALSFCEYFEEAIGMGQAALDDARRRGSLTGFATASYCRAFPLFERGQILDAIADLDAALQARDMGWQRWAGAAAACLACALVERGELGEAANALAAADQSRAQRSVEQCLLLEARARLHLADGDPADALADATEAGRRLLEDFTIISPYLPWRATAARAALALEDHAAARELIEQELELSRRLGAPACIARGLRIAGLIEGGAAGLRLLEQAADTIPASPPRLERIRALVDLGAALRRANKRAAAREPLKEAHRLARNGGATALAERAREELAVLGARPRKAPAARDQLTASERRVAELAQQGLTNKTIAQTLFVTTKAVEWHLHHAYQKLNINSRKQLAQALPRRE